MIIAVKRTPGGTSTVGADVPYRAYATIFTGHAVVHVGTARIWVAAIVGAQLLVITVRGCSTHAVPGDAGLSHRALVTVITGQGVVAVCAAFALNTSVIGAEVIVVTIEGRSRLALSRLAAITLSTAIAVVTPRFVRHELAT